MTRPTWLGRFEQVADGVADGVLIVNPDCRILYANSAASRIFGVPADQMVSKRCDDPSWSQIECDGSCASREEMACYRALRHGETSRGMERAIRRPDGTEVVTLVSATPLRDESGRIVGAVNSYTDVTRLKRAEESLRVKDEHSSSLLRLYALLGRANTYSEVLDALLTELPGVVGYPNAGLLIFEQGGRHARLLQGKGSSPEAVERVKRLGESYRAPGQGEEELLVLPIGDDPLLRELAAATHIVVVDDARTDPRTDKKVVAAAGNRTIVNVPLILAGRKLGFLSTGTFGDEGARPPSTEQLDYLAAAANHVAVAMDRVRFLEQRAEAEGALCESEERYRRLVEAVPEGIAVLRKGRVRFMNRAGAAILGAEDPEQLVDLKFVDLIVPERGVSKSALLGEPAGAEASSGVMERRYSRLDGALIDVEHVVTPFVFQGEEAAQVLFRDVTERRRVLERIKESETRLRDIIDNTNAYIYLKDPQGRFLLVNRQFPKLLGVSEGDLIGRTAREALHSDGQARAFEDRERQVLSTGKPLRTEEGMHTPMGAKTLSTLTFPLRDASRAVYAVCGVSTDITESKLAAEEIKEKDRAIRRAYVDVIGAVTGNRLILMTPEEIAASLGEPVTATHTIASYRSMKRARTEVRGAIERDFPGPKDLDDFMIGVSEGLTNGVKHAGRAKYGVRRRDATAQVVIEDRGPGVDFTSVPRATLEIGFSTQGTLGVGFTIMLETSDRVRLSTEPGRTTLVLELSGG